jgi:hypothetical protein
MLTITPARYAHLSDKLVVLSATGSLEYNGPSASWISSHDGLANDQDHEVPGIQSTTLIASKLEADVTIENADIRNGSDDMTRQSGDTSTWIYYGKSIGILLINSVLALIVGAVFSQNFQSTRSNRTHADCIPC